MVSGFHIWEPHRRTEGLMDEWTDGVTGELLIIKLSPPQMLDHTIGDCIFMVSLRWY